jgi:soluble P-type ATPase
MLEYHVPPESPFTIEHVVLDYNGTCAVDGRLLPGVKELFLTLGQHVRLHVLTADTFGHVQENLAGIDVVVSILPAGAQDELKRDYVVKLGAEKTVCIGNAAKRVISRSVTPQLWE